MATGKISIEELTGGTLFDLQRRRFRFDALHTIINPPQSAILGIHATMDRPVVEKRPDRDPSYQPPRHVLTTTASSTDARRCWAWLTMKEALEDPARMLPDV
ncbi:MAG: 2-oxo acid dehydrogenase subunit E2 [Burkholderiales bacterium]|nr:2-oxo acid dehydrogenase subunit E2 [Burkholderiales bacterium]